MIYFFYTSRLGFVKLCFDLGHLPRHTFYKFLGLIISSLGPTLLAQRIFSKLPTDYDQYHSPTQ
jgi:hypothetical protein